MFFSETIERFPKNKRFVYVIILHYCGLVSIPSYHSNKWLNLFHKYVYRSFVYFCISAALLTQAFVIFFYAIHDISQFLQRLSECLYLIIFFVAIFRYNLNIQAVIDLIKQMDHMFVPPNKKYEKSESLVMKIAVAFLVCDLLVSTWDTFSALSEQEVEYLVRIYHMDNPRRKLPLCFMPIDLNNTATYAMGCVFQFYIWLLWLMAVFQMVALETMFTSPVQEQFELLCEDIERIGERSDSLQELELR
uniref:Odorant receptor n=1 Tax=Cacopsylla melanoneura TaxID=428564 RepID=A0A8D8SZC5_9HEMI